MNRTIKIALLSVIFCLAAQVIKADGILLSWSPRDVPGLTEEAFNAARSVGADEIPKKNLTVGSWPEAFLLMVAANQHREDKTLFKALISQLTNNTKGDLKATNKLIIWERITSGEIQFEGKGYQVTDDLFTVAGRANWMLRNLTKKRFGYIRPNTSDEDRTKLQQLWLRWLSGEQVEEVQDRYLSSQKGLQEVRSPEALEALIVSLKPGAEKEKNTIDCLRRLYKLDKLPDDPNSPAALCNPDRYTHGYLAAITTIKDKHDYGWWNSWWENNKNSLKWNSEKGEFEGKTGP